MKYFSYLLVLILAAGCATFQKNAYATAGAIDIAVTLADGVWAEYVATGKASDADIERVNRALEIYGAAKAAFQDAMAGYSLHPNASNLTRALDALEAASKAIGKLISSLLPSDKAALLQPTIRFE